MLSIEKEILEDRQARLVVTVESERLDEALKAAARRIARRIDIPGFRKGKAPYHIVARAVGEQAIYEEALDPLVDEIYKEAIEESDLEPYGPAELADVSFDPFVLTFLVPLPPEVDLGNYRDIRVPFEGGEITNEDIEETLKALQEQEAVLEPVERPVEMGDVALLDIRGTFHKEEDDGESGEGEGIFIDRKEVRVLIDEESTYPIPGFPEKIVGMSAGEERTFDLTVPDEDEFEDLRGKTVTFTVNCREVYRYELPELDDEFARTVSEYETLLELRADIRARLEETAERLARDEYVDKIFDQMEEAGVEVHYPPLILEEEIDHRLDEFDRELRSKGITLDDYLRITQTSKDDLREEFREGAKKRLERGLILGQLIHSEKITVSDEEVEDEARSLQLAFGADAAVVKHLIESNAGKQVIIDRLLTEKAIERLIQIARGEAPDLEALEAEEEAAEAEGSSEGEESAAEEPEDDDSPAEEETQSAVEDSTGSDES